MFKLRLWDWVLCFWFCNFFTPSTFIPTSTFIREMRVKLELSNFSSPSVMHLSIEIGTGIRIGDLSQPNILAALLKITYVWSRFGLQLVPCQTQARYFSTIMLKILAWLTLFHLVFSHRFGFCVLDFLSILLHFLSQEKLTQKYR